MFLFRKLLDLTRQHDLYEFRMCDHVRVLREM